MMINTDVVIVGTGVAGLFAALHLPRDKKIVMITKADLKSSDSFLAQGGICVLRDENDYESFMEDTLKAGHYENRKESVDIMIRDSQSVIAELLTYGVQFHKELGADGKETLSPSEIAEREGLWQINSRDQLLSLARSAIESNRKSVNDYKNGKTAALRAIIGKAMAESRGLANPKLLEAILLEELAKE